MVIVERSSYYELRFTDCDHTFDHCLCRCVQLPHECQLSHRGVIYRGYRGLAALPDGCECHSHMSTVAEKTIECAACGGPIVEPWGPNIDFCSRECFRAGRAYCRQCGKSLYQSKPGGFTKAFCSTLCSRKFYRFDPRGSSLQEEIRRPTCKGCGKPITQNKSGSKQFCTKRCNDAYYNTARREYSLTDRWGTYAPETRKILLELEELRLVGTAKRLAEAVDREYKIRNNPVTRPHMAICHCKTCGKEFKRAPRSTTSRDYCSTKCRPPRTIESKQIILTWEEVDEIRRLYEIDKLSQKTIAEKYGVSVSNIASICQYKTWKLGNDPRRKFVQRESGEYHTRAKFTWEQIDEIRNLYEAEHLSPNKIAEKYGVSRLTISSIVHYYTWKPENDPRRKEIV